MSFWTNAKFHIFFIITIYGWYFEKYWFFTKKQGFFQFKIPICIYILINFPIFHIDLEGDFLTLLQIDFTFFRKKRKITYCINVENTRFFTSKSPYVHFFHQMRIIEKNHHFFANVKKTCFLSNFRKPIYTVNGEKY